MPAPVLFLILATFLPLLSFAVLLFVGKRMGSPLAGYVGTIAVAGSFVCTLLATVLWLSPRSYVDPVLKQKIQVGAGVNPVSLPIRWLPIGTQADPAGMAQDHPGFLDVGIYVDSLTVALFALITTVATLVHIFSIGYMDGDPRFPSYFTRLSLFVFSMLGLLLSGSLTQLLVFWELVGVCTYLLIGFWCEKQGPTQAAFKAFVVDRIGDVALLIGFGILFAHVGNLSLPGLWGLLGSAGAGRVVALPDGGSFSTTALTLAGIALFVGAIAKSAQFPLHVWLPDAAASPTPATGLIYSATTVVAGVYFVGRIYPLLTPDAKWIVAVVGLVTLVLGAMLATVQNDIKRLLAYAAVSQLGFMMLAFGVGSPAGGLFHLITHGFCAALLFLGAGGVIYAAHSERSLREYGGLMRRLPVTSIALAVGVLAIAGTPFLSGSASREMVLRHAAAFCTLAVGVAGRSTPYWAFFAVPVGVGYLTAFSLARCWMLTFWGRPRNLRIFARARENPVLYVPLLFLAVLAALGGRYLGVRELVTDSAKEGARYVQTLFPQSQYALAAWPAELPVELEDVPPPPPSVSMDAQARGETYVAPLRSISFYAFAGGIALGFLIYLRGYAIPRRAASLPPISWFHAWLRRKLFFDELYDGISSSLVGVLSTLASIVDRYVIAVPANIFAALTPRAKDK